MRFGPNANSDYPESPCPPSLCKVSRCTCLSLACLNKDKCCSLRATIAAHELAVLTDVFWGFREYYQSAYLAYSHSTLLRHVSPAHTHTHTHTRAHTIHTRTGIHAQCAHTFECTQTHIHTHRRPDRYARYTHGIMEF